MVFLSLGFNIKIPPNQQWYCNSANYAFFVASLCSVFFIVSMTFDRFYSIIRPHKAASFNTVKRAKIIIMGIVIFSIIFNIPHFYTSSNQGWLCLPFGDVVAMAKPIFKFYYWLSFSLQFGIPFALLLIMNSYIIHILKTSSSFRSNEGQGRGHGQRIKSSEKQIYMILLLITFVFLILTTPGIGGSRGGRARRAPPPTGPDSFILTCKIFET